MPGLMLLALLAGAADVTVVVFDEAGASVGVPVVVGGVSGSSPVTVSVAAGVVPVVVDGRAFSVVVRDGAVVDVIVNGADVDVVGAAEDVDAAAAVVEADSRVAVRVVSLDGGGAVAGARVYARGRGEVGRSGDDGVVVVDVAAGHVALSVVAAGHAPRVVEVDVAAGAVVDVEVALAPLLDELDELVVRAPFIAGGAAAAVDARRESKAVVEVVGREQMQKSGDGDAAAALRRVTGITVVGGRYVYVRGLGDRYSSTLVNGAPLPSPEPEKRVVPLDLFPSSLLESLTVQKTWSPELPGEFGGGSVQLATRSGGDVPFATLSLSTTFSPGVTFSEQRRLRAGALDVVAFDDGSRALPAFVVERTRDGPLGPKNALTDGGLDPQELERAGEALPRGWSPEQRLVLPGLGVGATAGGTVDTGVGDVGVIAALTWSADATRQDAERSRTSGGADGGAVLDEVLDVSSVEDTAAWGGIFGLSWAPADQQRLRAVTLINRDGSNEARTATGTSDETGAAVRLTRLRTVYRQLVVQQLAGEHALPWQPLGGDDVTLRWRAGWALALRDEPGLHATRYDERGSRFVLSDRSDGNQLLWSALVENGLDTQASLRLPFASWNGEDAFVDVGAAAAGKMRDVDTRRFTFLGTGVHAGDAALRAQDADAIFAANNVGADAFSIGEATRNTDNHSGSSVVGAVFVNAGVPVVDDVVVTGGVRVEASRLSVTTFELFNAAAAPVIAELDNVDVLPALAVAWTALDDLTLKAAASRSVVRPELRELSPALYSDVAGARARFGNPALQETGIVHADVRAEWALSSTDGLSLAVFGKHFDRPIESVVTAGADQAVTAANVDGAVCAGVEVEGRAGVGEFVGAADVPLLRGLWIGGNAALIASRVLIGEEQQGTLTSTERPLEGQSPWIANVQVGSDDDDAGFSAGVLYNVYGPASSRSAPSACPTPSSSPFTSSISSSRRSSAGGSRSRRARRT